MHRIFCVFILLLLVAGCATTKITAFRDPAFATKSFSSVVVFEQGMALDAALEVEKKVCAKIQPTPCVLGKNILPPIRQYTLEEVQFRLFNSKADGILFVALVGDKSDTRYLGAISNSTAYGFENTTGTVNFFGNSAYWNATTQSSVSSQTMTIPIYRFHRVAYGQIGLFDLETGNIVWRGEIKVEGKGAANITDSVFIDSATSKIAQELRTAQLIR